MTAFASFISLGLGVALAACAPRAGLRAQTVETCGGVLLVSGLALLGAALPVFR